MGRILTLYSLSLLVDMAEEDAPLALPDHECVYSEHVYETKVTNPHAIEAFQNADLWPLYVVLEVNGKSHQAKVEAYDALNQVATGRVPICQPLAPGE